MEIPIDFVGLNNLDESQVKEFKRLSIKFYKKMNTSVDMSIQIKKPKSNKTTLNARIVTDRFVFNIRKTGNNALTTLSKLLESASHKLKT